jgi:antitoxin PrlF
MIISKITAKGQITIPKKIRDFLKVNTSDTIEFTLLEEGKVLITWEIGVSGK